MHCANKTSGWACRPWGVLTAGTPAAATCAHWVGPSSLLGRTLLQAACRAAMMSGSLNLVRMRRPGLRAEGRRQTAGWAWHATPAAACLKPACRAAAVSSACRWHTPPASYPPCYCNVRVLAVHIWRLVQRSANPSSQVHAVCKGVEARTGQALQCKGQRWEAGN